MSNWIKKTKLSTRIFILVSFLLTMIIATSSFALLKVHHLGMEIDEIAHEEIPLARIVTKLTEYMLDQAMRFGEILQYGSLGVKEKFEEEVHDFIDAGERINDVIREGRKIAEHSIEIIHDETKKKELEHIKQILGQIEKEHGDYEHHSEELFREVALINFGEESSESRAHRIEALERMEKETKHLEELIEEILEVIDNLTMQITHEAETEQREAFIYLILLIIFSITSGLALSLFIIRNTVLPLKESILQLLQGAQEFQAASLQIANGSTSLSYESEKQASAVDNTTHIIDSINDLAGTSVSLADRQEQLIKETTTISNTTHANINEIMSSSREVADFGEKIGPLIKSLNDMAMQLNMLATNISAEVTRTQVAQSIVVFTDEMRSLAKETVNLAREADELTMKSGMNIRKGLELAMNTQEAYNEIMDIMQRLNKACDESLETSRLGQEKITGANGAINQINEAIQNNASVSEQNAAASEELSAQAQALLDVAESLRVLVGKS